MNYTIKLATFLAFILIGISCSDDKVDNLQLEFTGLENVGPNYAYEGWIMVDGSPVTTGVFTVDDAGNLSQNSFDIDEDQLERATAFILTIEPSPDNDPAPSDVHILAGDFSNENASLTVGHPAAIGHDFTSSTGAYLLATPTDEDETNETSGVWFVDPDKGPGPSLDLPTLPSGWAYEGWAVINDIPVSTGVFTSTSGADDASNFSGMKSGPAFPGEDFLNNAPNGLTFPTDLRGGMIVISVEPVPDNSESPFTLKPLVHMTSSSAMDHSLIDMNNNAVNTNPTGMARR